MLHGWLAVSAILIAFASQAPAPAARQARETRERTLYVSVVDAKGAPVTGLTAAEFAVREDGVAREVLRAGPATTPMQIMLLVDDSDAITPMTADLREGLHAFVNVVAGKAQVGLVTFGDRPTAVAPLSPDTAAVHKGIDRIFARPRSGAYLPDAVFEVARGIEKRRDERPVIVVVTAEGVQFSGQPYQYVLDQLEKSGAVLHAIAVGTPRVTTSDELRDRNLILAEGTERTGGRRDQLITQLALPERLKQLGEELTSQYLLTYARPESLIPPERVQVTSTRPDVTVRARTRVAGQ